MNSNTKNSSSFSRMTSFSLTMLGWLSFFKDFTSRSCIHSSQLHSGKRADDNHKKTVLSGVVKAWGATLTSYEDGSSATTYICRLLAHARRPTMCSGGKRQSFYKEANISSATKANESVGYGR